MLIRKQSNNEEKIINKNIIIALNKKNVDLIIRKSKWNDGDVKKYYEKIMQFWALILPKNYLIKHSKSVSKSI